MMSYCVGVAGSTPWRLENTRYFLAWTDLFLQVDAVSPAAYTSSIRSWVCGG